MVGLLDFPCLPAGSAERFFFGMRTMLLNWVVVLNVGVNALVVDEEGGAI